MVDAVDAVAVVADVLRLAGTMDVDALAAHLADDVVMELPYGPPGYAREHRGKDAVVRFQHRAARAFSQFSMTVDRILPTTDPLIVVAEHHSDGVAVPTGRAYANRYVTIFELDAVGRVHRWVEHYDPAAVLDAFE